MNHELVEVVGYTSGNKAVVSIIRKVKPILNGEDNPWSYVDDMTVKAYSNVRVTVVRWFLNGSEYNLISGVMKPTGKTKQDYKPTTIFEMIKQLFKV